MKKRILVVLLWSYTGWYSGAMAAAVFGISPWLGPILAIAALGVVVGYPRKMTWRSFGATRITSRS